MIFGISIQNRVDLCQFQAFLTTFFYIEKPILGVWMSQNMSLSDWQIKRADSHQTSNLMYM